jgi:hypothetical protein
VGNGKNLVGTELVITNGDTAASCLREAGIGTEVLPWQDILYEGPVLLAESIRELSEIRANYLGCAYPEPGRSVRDEFEARDERLAASGSFDRVTLWFEHDLCDQLQLVQIVSWFSTEIRQPDSLMLVQADDYLGKQGPRSIKRLQSHAVAIEPEHFKRANDAWFALCQGSPELWALLVERNLSIFPHLPAGVLRMLQELPDLSGLTATENAVLIRVANGTIRPADLFAALSVEDKITDFMGDWSFYRIVDSLALGSSPLLSGLRCGPFRTSMPPQKRREYLRSELSLTPLGEAVLAGREDYARRAKIDRWWGGTHLTNDNLWRWDADACRLIPP